MPRQSTCFDFCTSAEFGRRTHLCRDRQCGQVPGTGEGTFPSMSSRCCLRYSAHAFSSARVWSFEAIPNRLNANIKARTLTWGSAARPVVPHLRQVMIGVWMLRPVRIRCSIPSSSSRKLMSVGIDTPSCHVDRNHTTISGNQVRCASPDGMFGNLLTNCPFSTFGLRHCSRAASSELDIACESKPRNYSRDIAGARFSGKH